MTPIDTAAVKSNDKPEASDATITKKASAIDCCLAYRVTVEYQIAAKIALET